MALAQSHVIPALEKEGCRTFFVATLAEAEAARKTSSHAQIYVLDGLFPGTCSAFKAIEARPVLGSVAEIREWAAFCRAENVKLPAAIHLDSGMTRLGLTAEEQTQLLAEPELLASFDLCLVMSHLACADQPQHPKNQTQLAQFLSSSAAFHECAKEPCQFGGDISRIELSFRSYTAWHCPLRRPRGADGNSLGACRLSLWKNCAAPLG